MKPRIAITSWLGVLNNSERVHLPVAYVDAVVAAGGHPIVLPPVPEDSAEDLAAVADALVLAGGNDLDSALWGEAVHPAVRLMPPRRQQADMARLALADAAGMPVLGICLGCQEMAVHRGGRLIQHVPDEFSGVCHQTPGSAADPLHEVEVAPGSLLARIVGEGHLEVNSSHHQAVREAGRDLRVTARSPDGLIEAVEDASPGRFFVGVQWHPERLFGRRQHLAIFAAFVDAARR